MGILENTILKIDKLGELTGTKFRIAWRSSENQFWPSMWFGCRSMCILWLKRKTNTFFCYVLVSHLVRGEKGILLALVDI